MDEALTDHVARSICISLGLDPDEIVPHGYGDDMTPLEESSLGGFVPGIQLESPRWRLWRRDAAIAIAAQRSLEIAKSKDQG